ncbi:MAG: FecR domain-containing protein [Sedimentisphaerales bacterium]|nr:FecR domain-containing protein [Sedimentisphaerales bacterium]MBN2841638.1 FecR domain-containing protein [Sedimentisphaerales bacterium]
MSGEKDKNQLSILILKLLEGSLTSEELEELDCQLAEDQDAFAYYCEFMKNKTILNRQISFLGQDDSHPLDTATMRQLAQAEQNASWILTQEHSQPETPPKPQRKWLKAMGNSWFFRTYDRVISIAAVFFVLFLLYSNMFPPKYRLQVATLTDQINTAWNNTGISINKGERLVTKQHYAFSSGIIKMEFDQGVSVLMEGPAEFQILSEEKINLKSGKLYARVSDNAVGFSVYTDNAGIIDLGTEFGVWADHEGNTSVHVSKGKTVLIADRNDQATTTEISKGQAKKVMSAHDDVIDINFEQVLFVRDIDSGNNVIWHGQTDISLADIAGGGNGLGTARPNMGFAYDTGKLQAVKEEVPSLKSPGYVRTEHPFVDGVFIPDGGNGPVKITSTGVVTQQIPDTSGKGYVPVGNITVILKNAAPKNENYQPEVLLIQGESPEQKPAPRICFHANAGVTFDLDAIRSAYPDLSISSFNARLGYIQTGENELADSDIQILIDGYQAVTYEKYQSGYKPLDINIKLNKSDRFLTIVCTEGESNYFDWVLLVNPVLKAEHHN